MYVDGISRGVHCRCGNQVILQLDTIVKRSKVSINNTERLDKVIRSSSYLYLIGTFKSISLCIICTVYTVFYIYSGNQFEDLKGDSMKHNAI